MSNVWRNPRLHRDHWWAPRRMSAYLDGELAGRGRKRLERHVGECDECRRVLRGLQRMLGSLHEISPPAARPDPREFAARVQARLHQHPEE